MLNLYLCPGCKKNLNKCNKTKHCYIKVINKKIYVFTKRKTSLKTSYEDKNASKFYKNFMKWLLGTFKINEYNFRKILFKDIIIKNNQKILITGVGNGDDVSYLLKKYKKLNLKIFVQDLSESLIMSTYQKFKSKKNIFFNISDAKYLPFKDDYFDHVFHMGGINLFGNYKKSVSEMERITKPGGSVTFGDEGIAIWLRGTIYSEMLINNNKLWEFKFNLKNITLNAVDVNIRYLLGNCFYLVNYIYDPKYKTKFNYDLIHKSPRGGSVITRYISQSKLKRSYIINNLNKRIKD